MATLQQALLNATIQCLLSAEVMDPIKESHLETESALTAALGSSLGAGGIE